MNELTRQSVTMLTDYWRALAADPVGIREEMLTRGDRLLEQGPLPLDDDGLATYFRTLEGPDGIDARMDETDNVTWECGGGHDKSRSERVLREKLGLDDQQVAHIHDVVDFLGGHCDCEILMNAEARMLPEGPE